MAAGPALDSRNANTLWASVLVETLVRSGVRRAVISPGSRSTPLTLAFAAHAGIEAVPVLDERSAAFFALGLAKHALEPVVLLCTSGTAAANYFPAIIEAQESRVPVLVLTADRPPELRACASGQTIDQQKIFGGYVQFYHELALPEADQTRLRYLRQMVAHAVERTRGPAAGAVHLNVPFRDPLAPIADDGTTERCARAIDWEKFFGHLNEMGVPSMTSDISSRGGTPVPRGIHDRADVARVPIQPGARGVIVVGPAQPANVAEFVAAVGEISRRLGWPVLADGLTPLRSQAGRVPNLVTTYDAILRNRAAAERLKPEVVVCLGGWPTSKVLRSWLEVSDAPIWLVATRPDNRDALHGRTRQIAISLSALAEALPAASSSDNYARLWSSAEESTRAALDARLEAEQRMFEPKASWLLARHLPPGTPLFIANSMPVRDVEYVSPANDRALRPLCNRGANGIDGTLSSALGLAHAAALPAVLLTGDLALLHDTNGFLLRTKFRGSLTIVLINNRGGGIFEHLPIAQFEPQFEEFFATPQEADCAKLCAAYGVAHELMDDWTRFTAAISVLPATGIRVLELRTDRKRDAAQRKTLFATLAAELG